MKIPGPGQYNPTHVEIKLTHEYTFGQKYNPEQNKIVPAPGNYGVVDLNYTKKKSPSSVFDKGKKEDAKLGLKIPGPGAYSPESILNNAPRYRFGSGQRQSLGNAGKVPGPGAYSYREIVGNEAPKFSIIHKHKEHTIGKNVPGPGSYTLTNKIQRNSATCT